MFKWLSNKLSSWLQPKMAGGADTTSTVLGNYTVQSGSDAIQYIAEKTLRIAYKILRFYEMGDKAVLPSQSSKTFQYTRYERLPLPFSVISEGNEGSSTTMSISTVTATAEQWGAYVTITDVAELTIKHKPLQKALQLLGFQSGETVERECFNVVATGTSIFYPGTIANRFSLTSTDVVTSDTWRRMVASLRANGAMGMERAPGVADPELGDHYVSILDSYMEFDVSSDPDFIDSVKYAAAKRLWNGEIGEFLGVRFLRSNSLPTLTSAAAPTTNINEGGGDLALRYHRILVVGFDTTFNYPSVIYQVSTEDVGAADTDDSVTVVLPSTATLRYKIYWATSASDITASSAANAAITKYVQGSDQYFAASASIEIGDTANANGTTIFAIATSGTTAGSLLDEMASASSKTHLGFLFGKEAYTVVDLQNLQSTLTPPGASDSNPLALRRKAGWKIMFKCVINNNNFFNRVEAESSFD